MKKPKIENLKAWITGRELNIYQKADAVIEFNKLLDYVQELEQCTISDVVVPKGTLCECKKHSIKTNYGFEVCTKCGNEFDD